MMSSAHSARSIDARHPQGTQQVPRAANGVRTEISSIDWNLARRMRAVGAERPAWC